MRGRGRHGGSAQGLRAGAESTGSGFCSSWHGEFNVTELTAILGQSQPRVSRHLKLMCDAGLLDRHKEGAGYCSASPRPAPAPAVARLIIDLLPANDALLQRDGERLAHRRGPSSAPAQPISAGAAIGTRSALCTSPRRRSRRRLPGLVGRANVDILLDLGTGTGRMLELLAPLARQAIGIDQSRDMLAASPAPTIEARGLRHVQVRHGDLYSLPYPTGFADLITIHQVLHYLDDPQRALVEAARVLRPDGRLAVVDLAPHELEFLREVRRPSPAGHCA